VEYLNFTKLSVNLHLDVGIGHLPITCDGIFDHVIQLCPYDILIQFFEDIIEAHTCRCENYYDKQNINIDQIVLIFLMVLQQIVNFLIEDIPILHKATILRRVHECLAYSIERIFTVQSSLLFVWKKLRKLSAH
jgi:hypothetical protein